MKKGFTLIELMVVIVIIGILAAIAVPKMFGMSAKAKAAEVGPAAGSWGKVMSAYVIETAEVGSWVKAGYTPPGNPVSATQSKTSNFWYADLTTNTATAHFGATPMTSLNNCTITTAAAPTGTAAAAKQWHVTMTSASAVPQATPATDANCSSLTPNFIKMM